MQFECIPHNQQKEAHFKQGTWKYHYAAIVLLHFPEFSAPASCMQASCCAVWRWKGMVMNLERGEGLEKLF